MGKKKSKKSVSDKMRLRMNQEKPVNKFEVKINKQKHIVLGQKISKSDKGMPGISKSRSIKKRMETLLVEYQKYGKANEFIDKRIGEKNKQMSEEDKTLQRFKMARKSGSHLYNLSDDDDDGFEEGEKVEELTHAGKVLSQIERFEDPVFSDEEDQDEDGKQILNKMTEEHFGGGLLSKNKELHKTEDGKIQSHSERMADIVFQSILEKKQRRKEKNETLNQIEELNKSMNNVLPQLSSLSALGTISKKVNKNVDEKSDGLDLKMRMLKFLPKGTPSNRLKSPEELAKIEKERLEKLELDRLRRMKDLPNNTSNRPSNHRSADDLDDNYFNCGKKSILKNSSSKIISEQDESSLDENGKNVKFVDSETLNTDEDDEENDDEDDDDEDDMSDDNVEDDESNNDSDNDKSDNKENNMSDNDLDDISIDNDDKVIKANGCKVDLSGKIVDGIEDYSSLDYKIESDNDEKPSLEKKVNTENEKLEKLKDLFSQLKSCLQMAIDKLNSENKGTEIEGQSLASDIFKQLQIFLLSIYRSSQDSSVESANYFQDLIIDRQSDYQLDADFREGKGRFPAFDLLIYFQFIGKLFPTSDFRHCVVSPAMLFMDQILSQSMVVKIDDVVYGLFICSILYEYVILSKRYIPEVIVFLTKIINSFSNESQNQQNIFPRIKNIELLEVNENTLKQIKNLKLPLDLKELFFNKKYKASNKYKLDCLLMSLKLIQIFHKLYHQLPSLIEIFTPIQEALARIDISAFPKDIHDIYVEVKSQLESSPKKLVHLVLNSAKPQPIKQFEPKIEEKVDGRKKLGGNRVYRSNKRELIKYRKLKKGAEREIRKDQRFLSEHKFKEKMDKNKEREEKTKKIYSSLAQQEGDFKQLLKQKKKIKRASDHGKKSKVSKF